MPSLDLNPQRLGITMRSASTILFVFVCLLTCVRPAHAAWSCWGGQAGGGTINACADAGVSVANTQHGYTGTNACVSVSIYPASGCTQSCYVQYARQDGSACLNALVNFFGFDDPVAPPPPPPPTPLEASANAAKDAATGAGHSPAAAQAAYDAVMGAPDWQGVDPGVQAAIGASAASSYDSAVAGALPASAAAAIAAAAGRNVDSASRVSSSTSSASQIATTISDIQIIDYQHAVAVGSEPSPAQLAARIAAGALTAGTVVAAIAGAAPIAVAVGASAAIHAAILAANIDPANPNQVSAAQSAGAAAIQSGATPLQVTFATQAAVTASTTATSPTNAATGGAAAVQVLTQPLSSWSTTNTDSVNLAAATSAATAAESAGAASGTPNQIQAAAYAAADAIHSGQTPAVAASSAQTAASIAGSLPSTAAVVGAATGAAAAAAPATAAGAAAVAAAGTSAALGKSEGLLADIKSALGFGQSVAVEGSALDATKHNTEVAFGNTMRDAVNGFDAAQTGDENSLLGAFVFDPPYTACTPITRTIHGRVTTIDFCQYAEYLRQLIGWLFALFGAYSIYQTIFKARS